MKKTCGTKVPVKKGRCLNRQLKLTVIEIARKETNCLWLQPKVIEIARKEINCLWLQLKVIEITRKEINCRRLQPTVKMNSLSLGL